MLANRGCDFEIIVLDDHSTDRTAAIVSDLARCDDRVRLETAPPLPAGWCGKQHACHVLAKLARHPLLVFIDADVRLAPDALARMAGFMEHSHAALASGVPRQELGTFSERLLIPLIHFILLGFLPMHACAARGCPALSAGCGQLFIARRDAYQQCWRPRDAPRFVARRASSCPASFGSAGFATDLFDATDLATCRMYHTNRETWRGLGRNATEGLAAPGTILPMTVLLLGGQVLPFVLLAFAPVLSPAGLALTAVALAFVCLPRLIACGKFRQPPGAALLHPVGVIALLAIQWHALVRQLAGRPAIWKGRAYSPVAGGETARMA